VLAEPVAVGPDGMLRVPPVPGLGIEPSHEARAGLDAAR
jgi:L-alanine-DL-glutamate epimerase-like enolase superfamily enzyme